MIKPFKYMWRLLNESLKESRARNLRFIAAGLAFYMLFSLIPFIILLILVGGFIFGQMDVSASLLVFLEDVVGPQASDLLSSMVGSGLEDKSGVIASVIGIGIITWGANRLVIQMSQAFSAILADGEMLPEGGFRGAVKVRLRSLAYTMFLVLLVLSALAMNLLIPFVINIVNGAYVLLSDPMIIFVQSMAVFILMMLLFGFIYRELAGKAFSWKASFTGSLVASFLFVIINSAFSVYMNYASVQSIYGAAGSLIALLLWLYWLSSAFLFGASVSNVYYRKHNVL